MQNPEAHVPIALLSQSGEAGRHLRDALAGAGTPIVYEAPAAQLDRQALEESGARVVVVNLDADVESHLDDVYALLDDDRYNVIFDESGVSSRLSGWEQARWARHLAAKIRGSDNADPPRPEGAEAPPSPAPVVAAVAAAAIVEEAVLPRDADASREVDAEPTVAEVAHAETVEEPRAHEVAEPVDAPTSEPEPSVVGIEVDEPPVRNVEDLVFEAYGVVDTPAPLPVAAPAAPADDDALDFAHLDALLDASPAAPAAADEPLLDWELPATPTAPPAPPAPLALEPDFDLPAPPPVQAPKAAPAPAAVPPAPAESSFDFDFDAPAEAPAAVVDSPAPTPAQDEADDDFEFAWNAPAAEAERVSDTRVDVPGELAVATPEVFAGLELVSIEERTDDDIVPSKPVSGEDALGFDDLGDFADFDLSDEETTSPRGGTPERQEPVDLDALLSGRSEAAVEEPLDVGASLAAAADEIRSAGDTKTPVTFELLDLDWADAPKDDEGKPAEAPVVAAPPPVLGSALAWTLDPLDGEEDATPAAPPTGPAQFGIETVSAAEYLAPEVEATEEPPPVSLGGLSLELMPIEEAIAPSAASGGADIVRESWLDTSAISSPKAVVRKVWVLGASIGGPEAVREFLAQIPADYPALFLLAQHMGAEFMDIMAQQLAKTTKLMVRKPQHGERVGHGDLVIVPVTHRLRVDPQGVIVLEALPAGGPPHVPSIDDLLTDVAERFGSSAGTIVFSGMAEDAATGAKQLAAKGGRVYVQDPDTCVISAMVDGVIETGVVAFKGSPAALAERVLAERPAAGKTS